MRTDEDLARPSAPTIRYASFTQTILLAESDTASLGVSQILKPLLGKKEALFFFPSSMAI